MPAETVAPIEVRVIRYDLTKLRLAQALAPLALILGPIARRFQSVVLGVPAFLIGVAVIGVFFAARKREVTRLYAYPRRIKVGHTNIESGAAGQWRWHGHRATVFATGGNIVIKPRSSAEAEAIRSLLQGALGAPLRYRRRGSPRARVLSVGLALVGAVLVAIGFVNQLVYLTPAVILVLLGFALFATLSGSVPDTTGPSRPD